MAKNNNLTDFLTDVANTIRAKKGTSQPLDPQDFSDEIATISTSKPEGPANVTPTTSAQTIYPSEGEAFNVVNVSAVTSAIDDNIKASNIKAGVSILGVSGTLPTAVLYSSSVTLNYSTQTFTPTSGYDGFSKITITAPLEERTFTPSTAFKTYTSPSTLGFGIVSINAVTSAIDSNIQASNIKKDVTILGVTGTVEEGGGEDVYAGIINKTLKSYVDKQGLVYSSPLYFSGIKTLSYVELPACSYISRNTFMNCNPSSFAVSIPMVAYIGSSAFMSTGLSSICLPMTTVIGESAFFSCKNLTYFEAPAVSSIAANTFSNCYNLTTVSIPNVYGIGNSAFSNCSMLRTLSTFASSIASNIGLNNSTFKNLYLFTTSVGNISDNTFSSTDLNAIYVPTQYVESLKLQSGWSNFANKITALDTNYDNENIYTYEFMNSTIATIPRTNVINIGNDAFRSCANLTNVSLPNCKHIQMAAFLECPNINNVSLPNCEYILDYNFTSLSMLANLNLPSVKYIGFNCFSSCSNLGTVELPICQFISTNAFAACSVLNNVSLPQCRIVGESAFKNTRIMSVNLPECIMILSGAFSSCSNLTTITLSKCRFIHESAFTNCASVYEIDLRKQDVVPYAPYASKFQNPNLTIYVPKSLYSDFRVDSYWSYLRNKMISV